MENNMVISSAAMDWMELSCLDKRIGLKLPGEWRKPTEKEIFQYFPYQLKPQEVFVCQQEAVKIITMNLLEKELSTKQVYPAIKEIQKMVCNVYPESLQQPAKKIITGLGAAGWFSFETGGITNDGYHIMFVLSAYENMLLGSYHFPKKDVQEEKKFFLDVLRGIQLEP